MVTTSRVSRLTLPNISFITSVYHSSAFRSLTVCTALCLLSLLSILSALSVLCPRVGPGCVSCTRIDPLRFLAGCRRRRLNQGLVVALGFFSLLDRACFCVIFFRFMGACCV